MEDKLYKHNTGFWKAHKTQNSLIGYPENEKMS